MIRCFSKMQFIQLLSFWDRSAAFHTQKVWHAVVDGKDNFSQQQERLEVCVPLHLPWHKNTRQYFGKQHEKVSITKDKRLSFRKLPLSSERGPCDGSTLLLRKKDTHIHKHIPHSPQCTTSLLNIEHAISTAVYISSWVAAQHHIYLMDHNRQSEGAQ